MFDSIVVCYNCNYCDSAITYNQKPLVIWPKAFPIDKLFGPTGPNTFEITSKFATFERMASCSWCSPEPKKTCSNLQSKSKAQRTYEIRRQDLLEYCTILRTCDFEMILHIKIMFQINLKNRFVFWEWFSWNFNSILGLLLFYHPILELAVIASNLITPPLPTVQTTGGIQGI